MTYMVAIAVCPSIENLHEVGLCTAYSGNPGIVARQTRRGGDMKPMIRGSRGYNAHSHELLAMLGVKKLPPEGMEMRTIQGIRVYVEPLVKRADGKKTSVHRVIAQCPQCFKVMSAGRMHQHVCKF
jgi:hypothetical protein